MALRGGQDEFGIRWRLLERLQESVEGIGGKHVDLVDDEHLVLSHLRRDAYLLNEVADIVHRVVAGSIQLMDAVRTSLVEGAARLTLVAGLAIGVKVLAVDRLGKDAGTCCLAYATRAAEQISMRQLVIPDRILQGGGQTFLTYHRVESHRTVFSG